MQDENNKQEITLSKSTSALTVFSNSSLVKRGLVVANLAVNSPYLQKVREVLLSILTNQDDRLSDVIIDSARLLLEISPDQNVIARLIEISEETNFSYGTRFEALETLAKQGFRDFAIKTILDIFYSPALNTLKDPVWTRGNAIWALGRINNISEELLINILEFALSHDDNWSLIYKVASQFKKDGKKHEQVRTILINALMRDTGSTIKIEAFGMLIELGYQKDAERFLFSLPDFSTPKNTQEKFWRYRQSYFISLLEDLENQIAIVNNPNTSIAEKLFLLGVIESRGYKNTLQHSKIKLDNIKDWFNYLKDPNRPYDIGTITNIFALSRTLIRLGIETDQVTKCLLDIVTDTKSFGSDKYEALTVLHGTNLSADILQEKILPILEYPFEDDSSEDWYEKEREYYENEAEYFLIRLEAARILSKHATTRRNAWELIESQIRYILDSEWGSGIDNDICVQIGLLGATQKFIDDLLEYLGDRSDDRYNNGRYYACKCIVRMLRNQNAEK